MHSYGPLFCCDLILGCYKEDPSRDDSFDASAGTDESPPAQVVPVSAPQSPPSLSASIAPYRALETMQGPRKTFRPQPRPSRIKVLYPLPSPSIGPSHRRCRSPSPAPPALVELVLAAPALPSIPIDLLPPGKRFGAIERIKTAVREIESLRDRLVASEI
ncbi:hypothetical protein Tco_0316250 [Tanacetum coccineum]